MSRYNRVRDLDGIVRLSPPGHNDEEAGLMGQFEILADPLPKQTFLHTSVGVCTTLNLQALRG